MKNKAHTNTHKMLSCYWTAHKFFLSNTQQSVKRMVNRVTNNNPTRGKFSVPNGGEGEAKQPALALLLLLLEEYYTRTHLP